MPSHVITNFTAGEISEKMAGRVDFAKYYHGCRTLENMLVLPQGGAARRPGTVYVAGGKDSNRKVRLVKFEFSDEQAYMLEFGHEYIRFYKDRGQLVEVDSYTKLLLHMDGVDAGTSFTDDGYTGHTITPVGSVQIDTDWKKFGTGSLLVPSGAGEYLSVPDHADWYMGSGVFTIDFWCRFATVAGGHGFFMNGTLPTNLRQLQLEAPTHQLKFYVGTSAPLATQWIPEADTDYHIAVIRGWDGNPDLHAITINGKAVATATITDAWPDAVTDFRIGDSSASGSLNGWMDEFRVSKGIARWTSDFTPPSVEYPQAAGGTAYEIATPYTEADLPYLKFTQSADTVYISHPDYAPRKLTRSGHVDWTLSVIDFQPPPTYEADYFPDATLSASAVTGTGVTFTAGSSVFLASDAGRQLVYPDESARAIITTYSSGTVVLADVIDDFPDTDPMASGDWSLRNSPATGVTPSGTRKHSIITLTADDDCWRSVDVGRYVLINGGAVRITVYTSATEVKGEVLAFLSSADKAYDWTLETAQWDAALGYPGSVGFHEERLCFAGSDFWQQTVWGSVSGDYENHTGGPDDADALTLPLSSGEMNRIHWLLSHSALLAGSGGSEWRIGSSTYHEPLTPSNVQAKEESFHGVANIAPIKANDAVLFIQRGGRKLRELAYNTDAEKFVTTDLTILADHLTEEYGIVQMAWQKEPVPTLWAVRSDGVLLSLAYERSHDVVAWSRHITEGEFESVAVIPSNTGPDEVWVSVKRVINSSVVRCVEYLAPDFGTVVEDAWFVDSGLKYEGVEISSVSGLDHLEGETVAVLADGAEHPHCVVAAGAITLNWPASKVIVGLPMTSILETMGLEMYGPEGTTQGRPKTISQLVLRLFRTIGLSVGTRADNLVAIPFRSPADEMDQALDLFTGDKQVAVPGGWGTSQSIYITSDNPLPLTVLGICAETEVGEG